MSNNQVRANYREIPAARRCYSSETIELYVEEIFEQMVPGRIGRNRRRSRS